MEDGANAPSYPMNIINLAPLGSSKKKQKEHEENKQNKQNNEAKQRQNKEKNENKETKEEIKDNEEIESESIPIEIKVEGEEEKEDKGVIRITPKKEIQIDTEKSKRHRRTKDEITERQFQCPDCDKCYLSGPALTTHRKTKHGYELNNDKKIRGRPRKDNPQENPTIVSQNKYNSFFKNETRKPQSLDQTINDNLITLEVIQKYLTDAFRHCCTEHPEISEKYGNIEQYPLYKLVIDNWSKEVPEIEQESYLDDSRNKNKNDPLKKIKQPNVDSLFYLYLKEFSNKTNKEYFWFMVKFVVLFREGINILKKDMVTEEVVNGDKTEFTQIFNAEEIPEVCNDFFLDFMEPKRFFGLNKEELIELIQHFCFWLYTNMYCPSHLTPIKY